MGKTTYIRSTTHSLKFANTGKRQWISVYLEWYRKAVQTYVEYLWNNSFEWADGRIWDREHDYLDCPSMISTVGIPIETRLSARALKCAATQACGMINACFRRRKKDLELKALYESEERNLPRRIEERLSHPPSMPNTDKVNAEINSICCRIGTTDGLYGFWINLSSLFNDMLGMELHIPLKRTRRDNKWVDADGNLMPSILLAEDAIYLRYEMPIPIPASDAEVGCDQGMKTCFSFSDGTYTKPKPDGHDLDYCCHRIARTKPGSKNNKRAIEERKNVVGHAVNQIDFSKYGTIKYEKHFDTKRGKKLSRLMKAFCNPVLRTMLTNKAEESGVRVPEVDNICNSLRCSGCGWVRKANRKKKKFKCNVCGMEMDADLNASVNVELHEKELPDVPFLFVAKRLHVSGFFWTRYGFFDGKGERIVYNLRGQQLTVADSPT